MYDRDEPKSKRNTKSTKAKETYERNGGFSQKHIRMLAAAAEARASNTSKVKK
jgi:hypothetical protein